MKPSTQQALVINGEASEFVELAELNGESRDTSMLLDDSRGNSSLRWYLRGTAVGLLLMGSANALSYFFRSSDWGSLVGEKGRLRESVGFPFEVWEAGNTYGGLFADYRMLGWNAVVALLVGSTLGIIAALKRDSFHRMLQNTKLESVGRTRQPIQFSLRGLMVATLVAAVVAMLARQFAARSETLVAIYALGPMTLVAIAMMPHGLTWQRRIMIIVPAAYALIGTAIAVGFAMGMEFDKVLMGIFLCWTPQSAIAAVVLTAKIIFSQYRHDRAEKEASV
jgi:hypothetical protein